MGAETPLLSLADELVDAELEHGIYDEVADVPLHYVAVGEGEPVLFLHGFPQFWFLWRNQLAGLAGSGMRLVAPDLRGFNLSGKPVGVDAYRMRHQIGDILGLLDHLNWNRFTLVGHDWGGIVSWAFALKHPERLERLVILDSPPPFTWNRDLRDSAEQRKAVSYMLPLSEPSPGPEEMLADEDYDFLFSMLERIGGDRALLSDAERAAYREAWTRPGALTGGLNYYRAAQMGAQVAAGGVPEEYYRKITSQQVEVPTLVIWGEADGALFPHLTVGLEEWVPDLRIEMLPGCGHWVPYERPDEVNALIREFVS